MGQLIKMTDSSHGHMVFDSCYNVQSVTLDFSGLGVSCDFTEAKHLKPANSAVTNYQVSHFTSGIITATIPDRK